jgi:hypothetical protein
VSSTFTKLAVAWAALATILLLWTILGTPFWETSLRCKEALLTKRELVTNRVAILIPGPDNPVLTVLEDDIKKWCE